MTKKLQNIELLELNEAYQKVLYYFFSFPNIETSLNDLSKELQISKTTAKKIVSLMEEDEFLIKKIYGKAWRITCNLNHSLNHSRKIAFNLLMVYNAYYAGIKDEILKIVENAHSINLFGSYRKGDDTEKSDIDIAVEVADNKEVRIIELGVIPHFGHRKNVLINLHVFCRNKIDINLFSNIVNGIVLEGFLEAKP
ncbi:nucleotidyltransferase domain-containing protein [Candidatus Woesearchaeota archaeon]|nr:nucleotidyltransferase domain-containing protein [Candidatus Woesearchaeota archaeon]MCF8014010.1 nucleotidyltransferase domain-containing protein [Candidatus Woesearchaeota archaeon]